MPFLRTGLFIFTLVGSCISTPSLQSRRIVHEKRDFVPEGWTRLRKLDSDVILPMRFGLKHQNIDRIEELLMDVSHPKSPNYGMHWTPQKVADTFAPKEESIDAVLNWLQLTGFSPERMSLSNSRGWVELNATTAEVEELLDAEYHVYSHEHGTQHIACDSYTVPENIREHIDIILPTVNFDAQVHRRGISNGLVEPQSVKRATIQSFAKTNGKHVNVKPLTSNVDLSTCDEVITPDCLRALYNFSYTPVSIFSNPYGIVEYSPNAFIQSDLNLFFETLSPGQLGLFPTLISIDGGFDQLTETGFKFNGESNLDLQYGMALAKQPIILYQTGDMVEGASFNNLLDALDASYCTSGGGDDPAVDGIYPDNRIGGFFGFESCGITKPANVISTSYGSQEPEFTVAYQIRQCNEYAKLGMMGVTILYSSGDTGVAGVNGTCINSSGQQVAGGVRFNPGFPVNCPYVTAVGATQINPGSTVNDPEGACEQNIFSGGGFSDIFPMPDYQADAVTSFLTNHPPPYTAEQFNNSGKARGYPDLSANGANYAVAINGNFVPVFGTSCSSPVVGALLAMINDARIHVGKSPIGFINPTIYTPAFQSAFNDITVGGNQGCGTPGFSAAPGWDPVTGLGTPNFGKLLDLWLALP